MNTVDAGPFLRELFKAAVDAADPRIAVPPHLPPRPEGRVVVVGAGKASARMAQAVEDTWGPCDGLVIVPHGAALPTQKIELVEASHPVPDEAGHQAALRILKMLEDLGEDDFALFLISGGGSSLMCAPLDGISLVEKQSVNQALLKSGAAIDEMNCVRKHLSAVKGGRLAVAAHPARSLTLTISDVPGDDMSVIASGPTVPDLTTSEDALAILARYSIKVPPHIKTLLTSGWAETPSASHPAFSTTDQIMVARPQASLEAAAEMARQVSITPLILGDAIEGEAREVGKVMAGIAHQVITHGQPVDPPCVLLSGGETTVTVRGKAGRGGRNSEFLLSLATHGDHPRIAAIAADTDGIDGAGDNAGVVWTCTIRAAAADLDKTAYLDGHDAYTFFEAVEGLVKTGPTHTNVNDFRAILIMGSA